jgi:predicted DNA-binding protein with PD1-like motif
MSARRTIKQPGPVALERIVAVEARGASITFYLEPGVLLVEAVRRGFAAHGFTSGVVELGALALGPFAYVMPALSKTGENAAFYSDLYRPSGVSRLKHGAMTFGRRDDAPFFHCHALWTEADGTVTGGHIMPDETTVAERISVNAFGLDGALFEGHPDPETNFKLFGPVAVPTTNTAATTRAYAIRLRPNQDFCGALEAFCVEHNIKRAKVRGGVGSTIGARLEGGEVVENFATEIYVRSGTIEPGPGGSPVVRVDIGLVDYTGGMAEGRYIRGDNPVLMTFELVLDVVA